MRSSLIGVAAILLLASSCSGSDDDAADPDPADAVDSSADTAAPDDSEPAEPAAPAAPVAFTFTVDGVVGGQNVPVEYTCDGANETPAVTIEGVPADVVELALVVDDPDAPTESPFVHWVVYGISPATTVVTDGDASLTYGTNDFGAQEWLGPCPPPGDGLHAYRWKLFGLSAPTGLDPAADGRAVEAAIEGSVVSEALVISSYERAG